MANQEFELPQKFKNKESLYAINTLVSFIKNNAVWWTTVANKAGLNAVASNQANTHFQTKLEELNIHMFYAWINPDYCVVDLMYKAFMNHTKWDINYMGPLWNMEEHLMILKYLHQKKKILMVTAAQSVDYYGIPGLKSIAILDPTPISPEQHGLDSLAFKIADLTTQLNESKKEVSQLNKVVREQKELITALEKAVQERDLILAGKLHLSWT